MSDYTYDLITGRKIRDTPKERVVQDVCMAIRHNYGVRISDMARGFGVELDGRRRSLDVVVFRLGTEHKPENVERVVICNRDPGISVKSAYGQTKRNRIDLLGLAMNKLPWCRYGMWTDSLTTFFFERVDQGIKPVGDWPARIRTNWRNGAPHT